MITDENTGAGSVKSRSIPYLESNTCQPQNVTEENALWPVVPPGINENSNHDEQSTNRKKVNDTDGPEERAARDQVGSPQHVKPLERARDGLSGMSRMGDRGGSTLSQKVALHHDLECGRQYLDAFRMTAHDLAINHDIDRFGQLKIDPPGGCP